MLKKALHILFFSIAILLIQTHALIPHEHGDEANSTEWLGFLSDLADIDLGNDHLENYKPSDTTVEFDFDFQLEIIFSKQPVIVGEKTGSFPKLAENLVLKEHYSPHSHLRGPPFFI